MAKDKVKKHKILFVEEDPFLARGYIFFLERAGYKVVNILDGAEVYDAVKKHRPCLVLLDLILPGMHGFEILELLQKKKILQTLPVVVVSNLCQDSDIDTCFRLGAKDYIIKSNHSMAQVLERILPYMDSCEEK